MIRAIAVLLAALAAPANAAADSWPALYDVVSVAADDTLNVRSGPGAGFDVVGTLAHDAEGIEVTEANEAATWGRINTGEASGWVSLKFMNRLPGQDTGHTPDIAQCFGTEPFWTVALEGDVLTFSSQDGPGWSEALANKATSRSYRNRHAFLGQTITLVVAKASCSDGMSDRHYGLETDLVLSAPDGAEMMSGCCTLER
ncbi:MAG: SH3 domain-containing protein [Pseudomonadota bacterium]